MSIAQPEGAGPRSGSATSLVLTIIGLYLRRVGGWMSTAHLIELAELLGVTDPVARTAITRLKKRHVLVPDRRNGTAGYALTAQAVGILERGDRRIFAARIMGPDDVWCVISFSLPESQRQIRARLRRHLSRIGFGMIAPALWIGPDFLRDEVEEILDELTVRESAVLLRTEIPDVAGRIEDALAQWWDLDAIVEMHDAFNLRMSALLADDPRDEADAFARYVAGVDAWRMVSYLDPGLPFGLLPADWPGLVSTPALKTLAERFADPAWLYVRSVTGTSSA